MARFLWIFNSTIPRASYSCPYGLSIGAGYANHNLQFYYAKDLNRFYNFLSETGFRYQYTLSDSPGRLSPYLGGGLGEKNDKRGSPIFPGPHQRVSLRAFFGMKYYFWQGLHAFYQTDFSNMRRYQNGWAQRQPPDFKIFMGCMIGLGYKIPLGKSENNSVSPDTLPRPGSFRKASAHSFGLAISYRREFTTFPTKSYKFQYAFSPHPNLQIFAGLELPVSAWFFPDNAADDTTSIEGGRLGLRYLPGRSPKRVQYYGEFSAGGGIRNSYFGIGWKDGLPYLQFTFGNGIMVRIINQLYFNIGVQYRWVWVLEPRYPFWSEEHELDLGLSYRFGFGKWKRDRTQGRP